MVLKQKTSAGHNSAVLFLLMTLCCGLVGVSLVDEVHWQWHTVLALFFRTNKKSQWPWCKRKTPYSAIVRPFSGCWTILQSQGQLLKTWCTFKKQFSKRPMDNVTKSGHLCVIYFISAAAERVKHVPHECVWASECVFVCTHCKKPQWGGLSGVSDDVLYNKGWWVWKAHSAVVTRLMNSDSNRLSQLSPD